MKSSAKSPAFLLLLLLVTSQALIIGCKKQKGDEFSRLTNLGRTYYEKGEAEKAVTSFAQAVELDPRHLDARLNLANAYLLANEPAKAIEQARAVLDADRNSVAGYYI